MFTTGETVGLVEWIIDDTCLVLLCFWNEELTALYSTGTEVGRSI